MVKLAVWLVVALRDAHMRLVHFMLDLFPACVKLHTHAVYYFTVRETGGYAVSPQ